MGDEIRLSDIWTISEAELNNIKVSIEKYPAEYLIVNKLIKLYKGVLVSFGSVYPREQIPILSMFWTCFRGFIVSMQLVFQGHIPESYAITSKSAETVAISRKFSIHPHMIEKWIKRNKEEAQPFKRMLGELFPKDDKVVQPDVFRIYDFTTEHGRHPNFSSTIFYSIFEKVNTENTVLYNINDFDGNNYRRSLNYIIFSYHEFLIAYSKIFGKFLKKEWLQELEDLCTVFDLHKITLKGLFGDESK